MEAHAMGLGAHREPPTRLVLTWDIDANFQYDPQLKTEIEIRFISEESGVTRVELEHRRLDRFKVTGEPRCATSSTRPETGDNCWHPSRSRQK